MPPASNSVVGSVIVEITGGPTASVPWVDGMTALDALELMFNEVKTPGEFTFGLQYYGRNQGYLVIMINETYDSFISHGGPMARPFLYWEFLINGASAATGVSLTKLRNGDRITFQFTMYDQSTHSKTTLGAKFAQQARRVEQ
jgi:hypothetical protein